MILRNLPDELPNARNLLDAVAECRKNAACAQREASKTFSLLIGSVDTVAWLLAGGYDSGGSGQRGAEAPRAEERGFDRY